MEKNSPVSPGKPFSFLDPLVADFMKEIEKIPSAENKVELSGKINDPVSCWWCASSEDFFLSYYSGSIGNPVSFETIKKAESEESLERNKKAQDKQITPFYLIEIKIWTGKNSHIYKLLGINTRDKSFFCQEGVEMKEIFSIIFSDLKKNMNKTHIRGNIESNDLIGKETVIEKWDYSQVAGKIVKVNEQEIILGFSQGIKGVEKILYVTIRDERGIEHTGFLKHKS